ncbi:MAG TPA: glutamate formimidoyltransferase [Bacteroidota bacterium]|nr:glutamate formimidoyltransferase [Bacteroidota bacterium]
METIIECVPNFSEGRDARVIERIGDSISRIEGVKLLGIEPDKDYNRTVVTFIGSPDAVVNAAFEATKTATELIDMRLHTGAHPRLGATDVVPFIPVRGASMDDCVELSKRYASRVGAELSIPVYLYEASAQKPERRNLADVRKGEYEGLAEKLKSDLWAPDFGPREFNARSGGTITGARKILIAYNVNLNTPDVTVAQEIALRIRESGRPEKDASGATLKDERGQIRRIPGTLKSVKAMGVLLERCNIAQVSINLVDYHITPPHIAFEEVKRQAQTLGAVATGSELVGLMPLEAMLEAGRFYAARSGVNVETESESALVERAVRELGLSELEEFSARTKIIEYQL